MLGSINKIGVFADIYLLGYNAVLGGFLVTTAWRVLRLWMAKTAFRYWRVAANILNKQSRTANKGVVLQLGVVHGLNNSP
jgi:hypothetical protein